MRASLILFASAVALARPKWHELEGYSFDKYLDDFGKQYEEGGDKEDAAAGFVETPIARTESGDKSKREFSLGDTLRGAGEELRVCYCEYGKCDVPERFAQDAGRTRGLERVARTHACTHACAGIDVRSKRRSCICARSSSMHACVRA